MQKTFAALLSTVAVILAGGIIRSALADDRQKPPTTMPAVANAEISASPLDFAVKDIDGKDVNLSNYKGKVVMIVNVASKCGFTKQYTGLEALYKKYADQGFVILGFPANNFGQQEPGTDSEIKTFCSSKFSVTFPMMSKISVKGDDKAPLYKFLTEQPTAGKFQGDIGWNFTKFVVDRTGNVAGRFASQIEPSNPKLIALVEKSIAAK